MRIVFLGTPEFAVPSLEALIAANHEVQAVFTQPDRPRGRGNQITESPVKQAAVRLRLPVHQPERIRRPEPFEQLRSYGSDLMVVVGYGQIIPQKIIDLPRFGILNVHASLLPKYRGAAPIQWSIANGEVETGVTIMQIDAGLDTGDMLAHSATGIGPAETAPELSARLATVGARLLIEVVDQISAGTLRREKQEDAQATLAPILKREDGRVDWRRPARQIYNRFRGFRPWPGAYTSFRGQALGLMRITPFSRVDLLPGELRVEAKNLLVGAGEASAVEILEVQPANKTRIPAEAFINGYKPRSGERLGDED